MLKKIIYFRKQKELIIFFRKPTMPHNRRNILEHHISQDNSARVLDNSNVDEIAEEVKVICNNESDEYR